jgi:hypothetical protein
MGFIVPQAKPAKLVSALATCHVITSFVFFYRHSAFRARFSVQFHPKVSFILTNLIVPFSQVMARNWTMSLLQALKAEVVSTLADNICLLQ